MPTKKSKRQAAAGGKKAPARSRKPEAAPEHAPSVCTVCGYPRAWTGYATKEVKSKAGETLVAKWPTYEPCPNLTDPVLHPSYRRTAAVWLPLQTKLAVPDLGVTGILAQLPRTGTIGGAWEILLSAFQRRMGDKAKPKKILVSPADLEERRAEADLPCTVQLASDKMLTPGYGYVLVI